MDKNKDLKESPQDGETRLAFDEADQEARAPAPHEVHDVGFDDKQPKKRFRSRWHFLKTKKFWAIFFVVIVVGLAAAWFIQSARFWVMNAFGVDAGTVIEVNDAKSGAPVFGAEITLGAKKYVSQKDITGKRAIAVIRDGRFGSQELKISKEGYAPSSQQVTMAQFARGISALSPATKVALRPTGLPVHVSVVHWLSKKPIEGARIDYGELMVMTNKEGKANLNIPPIDQKEIEITISANSYHTLKAKAKIGEAEQQLTLIDAPRHYFVSKRTGVPGVYSSNLDGSDVRLLIAGTGKEQDNLQFIVNPNNKRASLVASRDGTRSAKGQLLYQLYDVDLEKAALTKLDESINLRVEGWIDNAIVYSKAIANESTGYSDHHDLMSVNVANRDKHVLAQSEYFQSIVLTRGKVFFATNVAAGRTFKNAPGFMSITPDERQKIIIDQRPVWELRRLDYATLVYGTDDNKWHELNLDTNNKRDVGEPNKRHTNLLATSANDQQFAWVDIRDGKAVLLVRGVAAGSPDKVILQGSSIANPIRWIGEKLVIYRVSDQREVADYVVSTDGGTPYKISDVSANSLSGY